jgi:hypothetical protein
VPFQNLKSVTVVKDSASTLAGTSHQHDIAGLDRSKSNRVSDRGLRWWREHAPPFGRRLRESDGDEVNGWGVRRQEREEGRME